MTVEPGATPVPVVLFLVGTDHHPFTRMVRWADEYARTRGGKVRVVVQHGPTAPPDVAEGFVLVPHAELLALIGDADVVVCHGGPATIVEVRRNGTMPVVVPREPSRGEHVDGHQQRFARRMGEEGLVLLCEEQDAMDAALDRALGDPSWLAVVDEDERARTRRAVDAVGAVVEGLTAAAGRRRGRDRQRVRRP